MAILLEGHGVSVRVPSGWEAELSTQQDPSELDPALSASQVSLVVLHAANFALPPNRDDYGIEAVESMGRGGIFMSLIEFARESASSTLFGSSGLRVLRPAEFRPERLLRPIPGQSGCQRFFQVGLRAFCLYSVVGSHSLRSMLVGEANRFLSGLTIT